jgi:hypothetical protein
MPTNGNGPQQNSKLLNFLFILGFEISFYFYFVEIDGVYLSSIETPKCFPDYGFKVHSQFQLHIICDT